MRNGKNQITFKHHKPHKSKKKIQRRINIGSLTLKNCFKHNKINSYIHNLVHPTMHNIGYQKMSNSSSIIASFCNIVGIYFILLHELIT